MTTWLSRDWGDSLPAAPLSWRDVYKAVGDSESRVIAAINAAAGPLTAGQADHEARIRAVETVAALTPSRDARILAVEVRAAATDREVSRFLDREKGIFTTLGAGKTVILAVAAMAGPILATIALVTK